MTDFLDPEFASKLKVELMSLEYEKRKNDLYERAVTRDLRHCNRPLVQKLREVSQIIYLFDREHIKHIVASITNMNFDQVMYSPEFRSVLSSITGIQTFDLGMNINYEEYYFVLVSDPSANMAAAVYEKGNVLYYHIAIVVIIIGVITLDYFYYDYYYCFCYYFCIFVD